MRIQFPRALKIEPLEPYRLRVAWSTGETLEVDLAKVLHGNQTLAHVLDPAVFARVHTADHGTSVEWEDSELGADNVYAWTREQMGEASHEMFFEWMRRHDLDLELAAGALGMSRRAIAYYRSGRKPIPRHVWLACLGWESLPPAVRRGQRAA